MRIIQLLMLFLLWLALVTPSTADEFEVDAEGAHVFVQFRVKHLGYSWLYGRFNEVAGTFLFDRSAPQKSSITMTVQTASVDSNHAVRDKHIRGKDFLNVDEFPTAVFNSTSLTMQSATTGKLTGLLTMMDKTHEIVVDIEHIGGGKDPWGGYREGFEGRAVIEPGRWGIAMVDKLGPASAEVELLLTVEGVRKKTRRIKK